MITPDPSNKLFKIATELVNHSSANIFLTGKAGTGKTTFLKFIKEQCGKQSAIVAPTGVAAINAGGTTIHSFFQLPFSPFVPGTTNKINHQTEITNKNSLLSRMRVNNEKRKLFQQLDLLIIDEVSMVRCDILDAIDTVLRHFRQRHNEPFGGVQVLLIGDMYQLPPVASNEEWDILSVYYNSPYFFSSMVMLQHPPMLIEFEKIYRQSDENFIKVLNQVRNNEMEDDGLQLLAERYQPQFQSTEEDKYIVLTTHNYKADQINASQLNKLATELFSFKAEIEGEFYEKSYPADEILQLKPGAQVMFIKNDSEKVRRYYNGKIGTVSKIDDGKIFVQCKNEQELIEVRKDKWENIRYTLDKSSQQLQEKQLGSFTQYPLRLAWAITIHKSQGLTFEKAVIDAGSAFAPGQVYVALSRCTNLNGLILKSRISSASLLTDERIVTFSKNNASSNQLEVQLMEAKFRYQQSLLNSLFDFTSILHECNDFIKFIKKQETTFNSATLSWVLDLENKIKGLQDVAIKFQVQLNRLINDQGLSAQNILLQQRTAAASKYFADELQLVLMAIQQSPAITDNRQIASEYNETILSIFSLLSEKKHLFENCLEGFDAENWHHKKRSFRLPPLLVNAYAGSTHNKTTQSQHPALLMQLRKLRDKICEQKDLPIYIVAGTRTLEEMVRYLPQTTRELEMISGFGKTKIQHYGTQFIELIQKYSEEHNLSSLIHEKEPKRKRKEKKSTKPDTKLETYKLYKLGTPVSLIATQRNLSPQTIEGHLAHYVQTGTIPIEELISMEKLEVIKPFVKDFEGGNITPIKNQLGNEVTFGEIKLVLAWTEFQKNVNS